MLDIAFIRENADAVKQAARSKNVEVDVDGLLQLDAERRELQQQIDTVAGERRALAKGTDGKPPAATVARGKKLKEDLQALERQQERVTEKYRALLEQVPNIPSEDTPIGADETANVVRKTVGTPTVFDFAAREHWELGADLGVLDTERAAEIAGSRFAYLKGKLVQLQFALIQLALSVVTDEEKLAQIAAEAELDVSTKPFEPIIPPVMIRPAVMQEMGRLEPREDRYHIPSDDLYLVGSAEHTLGPLHRGETLTGDDLPRRYVGYSTSFRREAGSYGKDVRGILRVHQFDKLEIESFTLPEHSTAEQDFIVAIQEHLLQRLELPYQVVQVSTGDMGGPDARQVDIETWLPGQGQYRETHTSDLMTDYQARRLKTKVKRADGTSEYAHMNDATVFAIGRMLIAIMENYQQEDGSIMVPKVLQDYVPFERIEAGK